MRLRRPCEHDQYEYHGVDPSGIPPSYASFCPGGEFLPEDAELVEKIKAAIREVSPKYQMLITELVCERIAVAVLDALAASQVGEPG